MKTALKVSALSLLVIATLAGCFKVNLDVKLSEDNTASGTMVVAIQAGVGESVGQSDESLLEELSGQLGEGLDGATIEDYNEDGYIGKVYAFKNLPLDTFGDEDLSITREGNTFIVDGSFNSEELGGAEGLDPTSLGAEFNLSVTFPGEVTDHNGTLSEDGHTVTWNLLAAPDTLHAEGKAVASSDIWIWVIIGLIILLIAAGVIFTALKVRGRNKPAEVPAAPYGSVPYAAASLAVPAPVADDATVPVVAEPVAAPVAVEPAVEAEPVVPAEPIVPAEVAEAETVVPVEAESAVAEPAPAKPARAKTTKTTTTKTTTKSTTTKAPAKAKPTKAKPTEAQPEDATPDEPTS